ncbi:MULTISPECIES: hypothetical protein [Flavobacterium]|nr:MULTISPECIES: hypothetical protein [Flavobacterium]TCN59623.1 hypothetical protein EV142_102241 [Flavobacterium circumlabens]
MEDYNFYKSKLDRELSRRNDLDNAINNPILGITIIVGLTSYIIQNNNFKHLDKADYWIIFNLILSTFTTLISLYFIFLSNNNLLKGFEYKNFGLLSDYRDVQKKLEVYNEQVEEKEREDFETKIVEKIITFSDNHTIINDKRALDLQLARKYIIISFILVVFNLIFLTINNLIHD